ncbi:hypothetical protein IH824_16345 [candidate division KSB1 bacterium]|nr:hypothetical protein [candidate division KSB1 bacterium]
MEKARQSVQGGLSRIDDVRHQITVGLKIVHHKVLALMFEPFELSLPFLVKSHKPKKQEEQ